MYCKQSARKKRLTESEMKEPEWKRWHANNTHNSNVCQGSWAWTNVQKTRWTANEQDTHDPKVVLLGLGRAMQRLWAWSQVVLLMPKLNGQWAKVRKRKISPTCGIENSRNNPASSNQQWNQVDTVLLLGLRRMMKRLWVRSRAVLLTPKLHRHWATTMMISKAGGDVA